MVRVRDARNSTFFCLAQPGRTLRYLGLCVSERDRGKGVIFAVEKGRKYGRDDAVVDRARGDG